MEESIKLCTKKKVSQVLGVEQQAAPLAAAQLKSSTCWAAFNTTYALMQARAHLHKHIHQGADTYMPKENKHFCTYITGILNKNGAFVL